MMTSEEWNDKTTGAYLDALVQWMQKLGRDMDRHASEEWDEHENVFAAVNAITDLRAQHAAQAAEIARLTAERDAALAKAFCMGRDAAAAWHTMQAETAMGALCCGSDNYEIRRAGRVSDMHRGHSEAIRTLTPPADLAAKIGGE